jgi:hypothetical protein
MQLLEPSERVTQLIARLDERIGVRGTTCEACGEHQNWGWANNTVRIGGQETLLILCRRCGLLRFHAASILDVVGIPPA